MEIMDILTPVLYVALIALVIGLVVAVVVMLIRLTKTLKLANEMLANLDPTVKNAHERGKRLLWRGQQEAMAPKRRRIGQIDGDW